MARVPANPPLIRLSRCDLRPLEPGDAAALARHADNGRIATHLRDRFPHPYTLEHAREFIELARRADREVALAITVAGEAIGVVSVMLQDDVERVSAEIGYWVGEAWWGQGIATEAVQAMTGYAARTFGLTRLFARTFDDNVASRRVLEKAGYAPEGRLSRSAVKHGRVRDQLQYAYVLPPG